MRTRTRWLRGAPKLERLLRHTVVAVELRDPLILVAQKTKLEDGKPERRSVGLTLEQEGVSVEVVLRDPRSFIQDLIEAEAWTHEAGT